MADWPPSSHFLADYIIKVNLVRHTDFSSYTRNRLKSLPSPLEILKKVVLLLGTGDHEEHP